MSANGRGRRSVLAALAVATFGFGCANVRTVAAPGFAIEEGSTYAWVAVPILEAGSLALDDEALLDDLRAVVDARFTELGLVRRPRGSADYELRARVRIDKAQRDLDTEFSMYVAEQYEVGSLTLELDRAGDPAQHWEGTATEELRLVAVVSGGVIATRTFTDEEREWDLEGLVRDIAAHLPLVPAR